MTHIVLSDIGDFQDVLVSEVLVAIGDTIAKDQPIAVLESDKAVIEIPSSAAGVISSIDVKVGDRISAGAPLMNLKADGGSSSAANQSSTASEVRRENHSRESLSNPEVPATTTEQSTEPQRSAESPTVNVVAFAPTSLGASEPRVHAGPAVRRLARELGVDLREVKGSGTRGRIVPEDVHQHVKSALARPLEIGSNGVSAAPFTLLPWPKVDYAKYGPVEAQPLPRIRRISAANLHRNWVSIPHVTNHDDADITELETFRTELNREHERSGVRISPLAFIMKACVAALKAFPQFNSSLDGETLILKRYFHIGFAADTSNGLMVPVIRDADQKGLLELAREMAELAARARNGKLASADMQGGTFSISSLGGIGGNYFTPIINAPEVAILGVGKAQTRVVWEDERAQPRLYLPLSLSWDHRVIDGAAAGLFNAYLVKILRDLRQLLV